MLVLTRKKNESIRIGDNVVITVTQIQGSRVRFGIEAAQSVRVLRGELVSQDTFVAATLDMPTVHPSKAGEFDSNALGAENVAK